MIIHNEDIYNDTYGRERMYLALQQRYEEGKSDIPVPSEGTVRKIMEKIGIIHKPRRKANGITKADREARKSDDLLKRNFKADKPLEKAITDISELKAKDGKVYVSAIFDCFDLMPLGLAIEDNMKASLCCHTIENAKISYPDIAGCIIHSDRGSQYTSAEYREKLQKYGIISSLYRKLSSFIIKCYQFTEKSALLTAEKLKTALFRQIKKIANFKIFGRNLVESQQRKSW